MRVLDFNVLKETHDSVIAEVTLKSLFRTVKRQVFAPRHLLFYKWRYLSDGRYAPPSIELHYIAWKARSGAPISDELEARERTAIAALLCIPAAAPEPTPADRQGFAPFEYEERN